MDYFISFESVTPLVLGLLGIFLIKFYNDRSAKQNNLIVEMLKLNDIRCTQYDVRIKKIEVDAKCNELLKLINTTDGQKIFLDYQHTNDIIPPLGDINALSADGVASWSGSPPYVPPT